MGEARDQVLTAAGVLPGATELSYDSELILSVIPGGVFCLDLEGRATLVNEAAARLLGWTQAELLGTQIHDIIHHRPPDGTSFAVEDCPIHRSLTDGQARQVEADVFWRKDGSSIPVEVDCRPIIRNHEVTGVLVAFRDLSEKQRAEERTSQLIREQFARAKAEFQHAQLRDLLAQAPALICVTRGPRHVIETVNELYSRAIGGAEVVGKAMSEAFPDAPTEQTTMLDRAYESGESCTGNEVAGPIVGGAGSSAQFFNFVVQPLRDDSGLVSGLLTHAVDVTGQVMARREIEAQNRLVELQAEVGLVLTGTDSLQATLQACAEAVVKYADAAFARIWILNDAEQMLELQASAGLFTHLDGPHARVPIGKFKIGRIAEERAPHLTNRVVGDPLVSDQEWARREGMVAFAGYPLLVGGELLGVLAMFAKHPLRDADLQALGAVARGVAIGIQKKRHEEALRNSERQIRVRAEELARLARALELSNRELDSFAFAASHDLRAPLRGIANLAQWIEEDLTSHGGMQDETRDMLQLMRVRMHRMESLIEGLLAYSRAGRTRQRPEHVDTKRLVMEVVDLLAPPDGVIVSVAPDLPEFRTERLPLQQVLQNLISNGIKHANRDDVHVSVDVRDAGEFFEFSVADNGVGLEARYQDRIWGIFQTLETRDKVEGTGIGLALVKKVVESQGGRAWVESTPGQGATFKFLWRKAHD